MPEENKRADDAFAKFDAISEEWIDCCVENEGSAKTDQVDDGGDDGQEMDAQRKKLQFAFGVVFAVLAILFVGYQLLTVGVPSQNDVSVVSEVLSDEMGGSADDVGEEYRNDVAKEGDVFSNEIGQLEKVNKDVLAKDNQ